MKFRCVSIVALPARLQPVISLIRIDLGDATSSFSAQNSTDLFDRWPPLAPATGLATNGTYSDLLGRAFRVGSRMPTW